MEGLGYAFLFRDYQAGLGKWTTSDPLGYPDGWNNFAYCNNDIFFEVDPLGLAANLSFYSQETSPQQYNNLHHITAPENGYTVAGHGNSNGIYYDNGTRISATELANMIKNDPNYKPGQTVYLISCNTGNGTYANELAAALGSGAVQAPQNYAAIDQNGNVYVGSLNAQGQLDTSTAHLWITSTGKVE